MTLVQIGGRPAAKQTGQYQAQRGPLFDAAYARAAAGLHPLFAHVTVENRCHLKCDHCYESEASHPEGASLRQRSTRYTDDMTPNESASTRRFIARLDHQRRTLQDEVEPDIADVRGLTPEELDHRLAAVVRSAWAIARTRGDLQQLLTREPAAPDFDAIWRSLVRRRREGPA